MQVLINLEKLEHNISVLQNICSSTGLQTVWVTKGCHSYPAVIHLLRDMGAEAFGDIYLQNFAGVFKDFPGERMMIGFPTLDQMAQAVALTSINLISCPDHAAALSAEAQKADTTQRVVLMVDEGNLREGVMPEQLLPTVNRILGYPGIELAGVGTSVGCFAGYCADKKDMEDLAQAAKIIEAHAAIQLPIISMGSGTMLIDLIRDTIIPEAITQVRIGAAFLVGEKPPTHEPISGLQQGAFTMRTEILELMKKPSLPEAPTGCDAFGNETSFENIGQRNKALLNIGMMDVDVCDLTPLTPGLKIIGASSNYTICDVTDCQESLQVGDRLDFQMGYSAMSKSMGSQYTQKTITR